MTLYGGEPSNSCTTLRTDGSPPRCARRIRRHRAIWGAGWGLGKGLAVWRAARGTGV